MPRKERDGKETSNQAQAYRKILTVGFLEIRTFTIIGGDYGLSWDVAGKCILAEQLKAPRDDDADCAGTMFQLVGVCSHCETIHMPIFIWHPLVGLGVVDPGGLVFPDAEREPFGPTGTRGW